MSKLYELLAAAPTATNQAQKVVSDLMNTFNSKVHHFRKKIVTFTPKGEGAAPKTEEQSEIQATVRDELKWVKDIWSKALDLQFQIDDSNLRALSDVKLDDGTVLIKDVPTTQLLQLEKRIEEIRAFVATIPTLDPTKGFRPDQASDGLYVARDVEKERTQKVEEHIVVVQPTKEHPAQTAKVVKDVVTGTIREQEWSGLITPKTKAEMLGRIEILTRAVKTARQRANDVVASDRKIGNAVLSYAFEGTTGQRFEDLKG